MPEHVCKELGLNTGTERCSLRTRKVIGETSTRYLHIQQSTIIMATVRDDATGFYVTSANGQLTKAIYWKKALGPRDRALSEAQADFEKEKSFWLAERRSGR